MTSSSFEIMTSVEERSTEEVQKSEKLHAFQIGAFPIWKQLLIAAVVVSAISGFFFFLNRRGLPLDKEGMIDFAFGVSIGVSLWLSMGYLNSKLAPKVNWLERPWRALAIVLPANVLAAILAQAIVRFTFICLIFGQSFGNWIASEGILDYLINVLVGLVISSIYQGAWFIRLWKNGIIEKEQLKSSQAAAQYEVLNAQVNPHFLFNSLNVLSNLVRTSPEKAEDFIQGLSHVYRYVLEIRKEEAVLLSKEVEALSNYTALLKTRFGERIQIDDQLSPKLEAGMWSDRKIVPLALQMLLENNVKHNGATQKNPLHVKLYEDNDWIIVTNSRPPRFEDSVGNGVGLSNIQERYQLLIEKSIIVEENDDSFTVKLPLI